MSKIIILLFSLLEFFNLYGCTGVVYSENINNAELALIDSDFKKANQYYKLAYKESKGNMFVKDMRNYALSSIFQKDTSTAISCLTFLVEKDVKRKELEKNEYFKSILHKIDFTRIKKGITNYKLHHIIDSLIEIDQKFRNHDSAYVKYKKEIWEIDSLNAIILKKIFDENGFPSELEIGYTQMQNLSILLLHQGHGQKRLYDFSEYIQNGIANKKVQPHMGAYIYMRLLGKDIYGMGNSIIKISLTKLNSMILSEGKEAAETKDYILGYYSLPEERLLRINKDRKEIGLDSIFESRKKLTHKLLNNNHPFTYQTVEHYSVSDKNQYDFFVKGFIRID